MRYAWVRSRPGGHDRVHRAPDPRAGWSERIRSAARPWKRFTSLSGGIPRLINTLATTALLEAFGEDAGGIDPSRVVSAAREHRMEARAHG